MPCSWSHAGTWINRYKKYYCQARLPKVFWFTSSKKYTWYQSRRRDSPRVGWPQPCMFFELTSQQSRQCLADFGWFMRVAHRNAPNYGVYGLLDFWQIFGKTVF